MSSIEIFPIDYSISESPVKPMQCVTPKHELRLTIAAQILSSNMPESLSAEAKLKTRFSLQLAEMLINTNDELFPQKDG